MSNLQKVSLVFIVIVLILSGCRPGGGLPSQPQGISEVPEVLGEGEFILTWAEPLHWGRGSGKQYRVEFYDGESWTYLGTTGEKRFVFSVPSGMSKANARFSVRSETSLGHSAWLTSNSFAIDAGPKVTITIQPGEVQIDHTAGTFTLSAILGLTDEDEEAQIQWSCEADWLSLPGESAPGEEIMVSAGANNSEERTAVITAALGNSSATVTVTQAGKSAATGSLTIAPSPVRIDFKAQEFQLTATLSPANGEAISWSSSENWLTLQPGGNTVRVTTTENVGLARTATITALSSDGRRATVTITQTGHLAPDMPGNIGSITSPRLPGKITVTWTAPVSWGTGEERGYRVEFFDGESWVLVGTTSERSIEFELPKVSVANARFRVRSQTSHGFSQYRQSAPFRVETNMHFNPLPVVKAGEITVSPHRVYYENGNLVFEAWIANGYSTEATITEVLLFVSNPQGEIAARTFTGLTIKVEAGKVVQWKFTLTNPRDAVLTGVIDVLADCVYTLAE